MEEIPLFTDCLLNARHPIRISLCWSSQQPHEVDMIHVTLHRGKMQGLGRLICQSHGGGAGEGDAESAPRSEFVEPKL